LELKKNLKEEKVIIIKYKKIINKEKIKILIGIILKRRKERGKIFKVKVKVKVNKIIIIQIILQ
jgi:hypothetical protein